MNGEKKPDLRRYARQVSFPPLGPGGQRRLAAGRVLVVGAGGLGTHAAELLARAGVGFLRLVDDDRVDLTNLHRQSLYDADDAEEERPKVRAAAAHLRRINAATAVEAIEARLTGQNMAELADGVGLILDGTDNFAARFVINDYAVKTATPWVFAGAVGAEGQVLAVVPPRTPCLRCLFDAPPPPCADPSCRAAGVLGPAVAAIAALQAAEAIKLLAGAAEAVSPYLLKLDLWANTVQRIDAARAAADADCPCCKARRFDYLSA